MRHQTRRDFLRTASGALPGLLIGRSWLATGTSCTQALSLRVKQLGDLDETDSYDVCVVGSGPAGALLATGLVRRGFKTLILESGPAPRPAAADPTFSKLDAYSSSGKIYPVRSSRFRGAGGTSNLWTGSCTRFLPLDLEPNAYTSPDAPWPISYADLGPFYQRAEAELRVRGVETTSLGAPRTTPYPLPFQPDP